MLSSQNQKHPKTIILIGLILALAFSAGIRFIHLEKGFKHYLSPPFLENDTPLMTTLDAYYYLSLTDDYLSGTSSIGQDKKDSNLSPGSTPLLAVLTASIHNLTQIPLEKLAFYLPCFLASFMVFVYFCWGLQFNGASTCLFASCIGMGSYYWYTRTCLGRFDTDGLIPFFVYGISYLIYRFSVDSVWRSRLAYLTLALLMAYLFQWWWQQGLYLNLLILLVPYSLSLFFLSSNRVERFIKIALLMAGFMALTVVVFDLAHLLPFKLSSLFDIPRAYFSLITKDTGGLLPGIGQSISELEPVTYEYLSQKVAGNPIILIMALTGMGLLIKKHGRIVVFLAFPFFLGMMSIFARRFLIYFIPLYALGLAYFLKYVSELTIFKRIPFWPRHLIFIGLALTIIYVNSAKAFKYTIRPRGTSSQVTLAKAIQEDASSRAVIWNWWDYGYFLQYYAKRRTMVDGGNQNPLRFFITAFPLTAKDPVLARNWIKFFAAHGVRGLRRVNAHFNDIPKAIRFLKVSLAHPEKLQSILAQFGLKDQKYWTPYLFPKADVYLYLTYDLFSKSYWWYYFGSWNEELGHGVHPTARFLEQGQFVINRKDGLIRIGDKSLLVSDIYYFTLKPVPHVFAHKQYKNKARLVLIYIQDHGRAYLLDEALYHSLFVKLFFTKPLSPPSGFKTVKYVPFQGGIWQVE